jgi:16S rRNA (adenine1518-N6/adenine1519-N6)-dimethyltransferase
MDLLEKTKKDLKNIKINEKYDQHFLVDDIIIERMMEYAELKKEDTILEIGPGTGNITNVLAKRCKKVVAIEIDERFRKILNGINNLELKIGNASEIFRKKDVKFNKIVSNLPFQFCEVLFNHLTTKKDLGCCVVIVPKSFFIKSKENPRYSALSIELIEELPKDSFYPEPDTDSIIIKITRKS